mmetsp:Transcript_12142/g.22739  ORF Transcript_12142/g.22739 Transcript_12142/m.22739 type:complete len:479 (-) Transcript_12142:79-1515(-)|eukprot:CAMPEP_0176496880 /NCGR_PEP_ID=MMETSP0200_2-20121128/11425_1 /TAXON_ID=947934 /ORGANISM="Chaetoceros sp., Strain GSL56" /LENGTH=478 /DNA_ID=CAMNT_0017894853 /DNA_START=16 /DNA_END=1452 /DNA_ORIENTATION=-
MTIEDNHSPKQRGVKRSSSDIVYPIDSSHEEKEAAVETEAEADATNQQQDHKHQSNAFVGPYQCLQIHGEHKRAISCVSFAPTIKTSSSSCCYTKDQIICASASADGTVRLWDITHAMQEVSSGPQNKSSRLMTPVGQISGHSRGINDLAWSPRTPNILATASDDKTLRLWDVTRSSSSVKGRHIQTTTTEASDATDPNMEQHSSGSPILSNTVGQPSVGTGTFTNVINESLVEFKGHSNFCFSVKFNPQGNLLVSGSFDETVKIWDIRTGECVSTLPAHSDPVTGVDFNRDGTCIVSSSHDGLMRIWDVASGECLKTIYADGNPPVTFVKYSHNGKYVLSGMLDGKLRLWNVVGGRDQNNIMPALMTQRSKDYLSIGLSTVQGRGGLCTKTYSGHVNSKYCIFSAFAVANPARQSIVTGSEDGKIHLYDLQTRKTRQVLDGHKDACLAVAAHDSREVLASGGMSNDCQVKFWVPITV